MKSKPAQNPFKWEKAASPNRLEQCPARLSLQKHEPFGYTIESSLSHSSRYKKKKKQKQWVALLCILFDEYYIKPLFCFEICHSYYIELAVQDQDSEVSYHSWFLVRFTKSIKMIRKNKGSYTDTVNTIHHHISIIHTQISDSWFYKLQCYSEALKY